MTKNVAPNFSVENQIFLTLRCWLCFFFLLLAKQQKILGQMFVPFICQTVVVVVCPLFSRLFANPSAL